MNSSDLIVKYKHQLILKNYSANTIDAYLSGLNLFLGYIKNNKLTVIDGREVERYFYYCKQSLGYSYSAMKLHLASVKFLYEMVLIQDIDFDFNIKMKKPTTIPEVLSVEEVQRFLNTFSNLKHKAIFMLCYSAGLRLSELFSVKISDIDSDRMQIRIQQAKWKKDILLRALRSNLMGITSVVLCLLPRKTQRIFI